MYNIIQLNDKNLSELQQIAKELGLKKVDSLKKEELVYRPRKRSRISIKKEGDKVYTATKDKAQKLEANTPALPAPTPLFKEIPALPEQTETVAPVTEKTAQPEVAAAPATEEKPKAKRGRKPGSKNKSTLAKEAQEAAENKPAEVAAKPAPLPIDDDDMELPPLDLNNNDFIPIEDLPSEKFEIPSELLGKFEATKMEVPVMPAKEPKQKNQQRQARQNNRKKISSVRLVRIIAITVLITIIITTIIRERITIRSLLPTRTRQSNPLLLLSKLLPITLRHQLPNR